MVCKQVTRVASPEALPGRDPARDLQGKTRIVI